MVATEQIDYNRLYETTVGGMRGYRRFGDISSTLKGSKRLGLISDTASSDGSQEQIGWHHAQQGTNFPLANSTPAA